MASASSSLPVHQPFSAEYPALQYTIVAKCPVTRARASVLRLPHGPVETPVFMYVPRSDDCCNHSAPLINDCVNSAASLRPRPGRPVGTQGTIKGLTSEQMERVGCQIILGNTYHLANRPGADLIEEMGGLHRFMNWKNNILTDSGGFQMVSLLELSTVSEQGVTFTSPVDGSPMLLTPEKSIHLQNQIGSDIMMMLDDVVSSVCADEARFKEATHRTIRWLDRCIAAHRRPHDQNLFAIVQGGLDRELREWCLDEMLKRDRHLPGYAIGGISGGEDKNCFWRVVEQCTARLPTHKPIYTMGVGYPLDLVVCCALGVDMWDCVYPCRTARFGTALVPEGLLRLKSAEFAADQRPIDPACDCIACTQYTRAYLYTVATHEAVGAHLLTLHNMHYMKRLMRDMRASIVDGRFPAFVQCFLDRQFPNAAHVPQWVRDALAAAGMRVREPTPEEAARAGAGASSGAGAAKAGVGPATADEAC